jgi:CheY-like chemotaxis protein
LIRQMLAFSRRQPLQPKLVELNPLVSDTMCLLSWALGEAITVDVQTAADAGAVFVDGQQLGTALMNIAINARDAMPNGGTLTIATRKTTLDAGHPALQPATAGGTFAVVEITDTGCGMPPKVLERIFEPFYTTKAVGKGTGLGLSMVYGFMKQSGGHISAYSEVGRGTTFRLYLPVQEQASAQPAPRDALPPQDERLPQQDHAEGQVILAVDDNPDVRAIVVAQLKSLGYAVCEADSAQAALQIISSPARIDLLFTDVVMPGGMNGKELATQARLTRPGLKVLFTSGFPVTSPASGAAFENDDLLLSKPYRNQDLAQALHGALAA